MDELAEEKYAVDAITGKIGEKMKDMAGSYVAIGYYLRKYQAHGYQQDGKEKTDVWGYAERRFGMSKSTASRLISIFNQFGDVTDDWNTIGLPHLQTKYKDYSYSQLQELISQPESVLKRVKPTMTVLQIREAKQPTEADMKQVKKNLLTYLTKGWCYIELPEKVYKAMGRVGNYASPDELLDFGLYDELTECLKEQWVKNDVSGDSTIISATTSDEGIKVKSVKYPTVTIPWDEFDELIRTVKPTKKLEHPIEEVATSQPEAEPEPEPETEPEPVKRCTKGPSKTGYCGAAAYCDKDYQCCMECPEEEHCNSYCGWISEASKKMCRIPGHESEECNYENCKQAIYNSEEGQCPIEAMYSGCCSACNDLTCGYRCNNAKGTVFSDEKIASDIEENAGPEKAEEILASAEEAEEHDPVTEDDAEEPSDRMKEEALHRILNRAEYMLKEAEDSAAPVMVIMQEKAKIAGCKMLLEQQYPDAPQQDFEQPELPDMKNNDERKKFLEAYEEWPVWIDTPEMFEKVYRYELPNENVIAVRQKTENNEYNNGEEYKFLEWFYFGKNVREMYESKCKIRDIPNPHNGHASISLIVEHLKDLRNGGSRNEK